MNKVFWKNKAFVLVLIVVMIMTLMPQTAFAEGENYPTAEWWNYRNSEDNNGVTDRETPVTPTTASLKWAQKYGSGWSHSVTPPIIVGGYLYSASGTKLLKISKETGEVVANGTISKGLGAVGFAMNPIVYGDGKLFVQVDNGQIEAFDINTLDQLWISENVGGQTISPITYKSGYIYTGSWVGEEKDGSYVCMSTHATNDVELVGQVKTKKLTWQLKPGEGVITQGGIDESGKVSLPRGFYWAGAYASDNYVVFGADDGSKENDYRESAMLYSMHPTSGAILDTIEGIDGDVRTTMVHKEGYLYFATKGSRMYKVKINDDGTFDNLSSINTGGMMTASPVVYKDRIYLGVAGASQFDPDSGHVFAVIKDDAALSQDSFMYSIPIPGYPQAASLLSTQLEEGNGEIYVYFAYNANPGGIYCLKDKIDDPTGTGKAINLFTPPLKELQEHCISTISCDSSGTMYYKNDSGYLIAVEKNEAYLEDVKITPDTGESKWDNDYNSQLTDYSIKVPADSTKVKLDLNIPEGATVTLNNSPYDKTKDIPLEDGQSSLTIVVKKATYEKQYNFEVKCKNRETNLSEIKLTTSNSYTGEELQLNETFDPTKKNVRSKVYNGTQSFMRFWPTTMDVNATVKVWPVENISRKGEDGSINAVYSPGVQKNYYGLYFTQGETYSKVRVEVTSENGTEKDNYYLTIFRTAAVSGSNVILDKESASIYAKGPGNTVKINAEKRNFTGGISWESDDSNIAKVDKNGQVTGVAPGKTLIRADIGDAAATCEVTVKAPTITLNGSSATIYKADSKNYVNLKATVNGKSGQKVNWKVTSGSKYASVDSSGKVKAKAQGTAYVTAEANGVSSRCKITVKNASFSLKSYKATLKKGKKYTIKVKTNSPKGKVTYKSKSSKIASVTSKGVIKGKKKGKTYVTVKCNGITKKFTITVK